jgi:hypothetical protein
MSAKGTTALGRKLRTSAVDACPDCRGRRQPTIKSVRVTARTPDTDGHSPASAPGAKNPGQCFQCSLIQRPRLRLGGAAGVEVGL